MKHDPWIWHDPASRHTRVIRDLDGFAWAPRSGEPWGRSLLVGTVLAVIVVVLVLL